MPAGTNYSTLFPVITEQSSAAWRGYDNAGWLAGRGSARRGAAAGRRYLRNVLGASVIKLGTTSPLIPSERPPARSLTRIKYFSVIISVDSMFQKRPTAGRVLFGDAAPPRSRPPRMFNLFLFIFDGQRESH
ncbi:hypothetical protein EVAR_28916_1 [Eumeta japonica]|uniref:Uncharacterized protein n=1 Tax=Eumeta variegata TaxID=151549 RepID=A0A4C1YJI1_EUMVA|nr:hypothetical protein EVAR_28916_1 [Eumeta japonica]